MEEIANIMSARVGALAQIPDGVATPVRGSALFPAPLPVFDDATESQLERQAQSIDPISLACMDASVYRARLVAALDAGGREKPAIWTIDGEDAVVTYGRLNSRGITVPRPVMVRNGRPVDSWEFWMWLIDVANRDGGWIARATAYVRGPVVKRGMKTHEVTNRVRDPAKGHPEADVHGFPRMGPDGKRHHDYGYYHAYFQPWDPREVERQIAAPRDSSASPDSPPPRKGGGK